MNDLPEFPPSAFLKQDPAPDEHFYAAPRFVSHIDDDAIASVTDLYRKLFPSGGVILDLMSSWVSHLPRDVAYAQVVGHGMNEQELAANAQLTRYFVQNLDADALLPLDSASIDGAAICVSIQYLQTPVAVLRELTRVLKPGAPVVITFSNRCFPTKAIALWRALSDEQHSRLVALYLQRAGFSAVETLAPARIVSGLFCVMGGIGVGGMLLEARLTEEGLEVEPEHVKGSHASRDEPNEPEQLAEWVGAGEGAVENLILREEASPNRDTGDGEDAHRHGPEGDGDALAKAAHLAHVLLAGQGVDD